MADRTGIEWTDASWNPIVGCSIVSPGCTNCYAMAMSHRINQMTPSSHYEGITERAKAGHGKAVWTGKVAMAPDHILTAPIRWKRPRRIFVNSMGDLFHESVHDEWIDRVFAIMALSPQHTFQVLTKRAKRMREYGIHAAMSRMWGQADIIAGNLHLQEDHPAWTFLVGGRDGTAWPLPNVWLGVSAEDQTRADERIPDLLATPASIRFVSAEPLLGPIDFEHIAHEDGQPDFYYHALDGYVIDGSQSQTEKLDWVVAGGESGPGARPMHPDWARSLRDQCAAADVPFFFKQWGEWQFDGTTFQRMGKRRSGHMLDGREHHEFPKT